MQQTALKAQNLRSILIFLIVAIIGAGGALFYFSLGEVRTYAVSVNERLADAEAGDKQVQQLQSLKSQLAQSQLLVDKAEKTVSSATTYQAQALTDVRTYANQTGITIASTEFLPADPATGKYLMVVKLANPVSYSRFIQFITLIETNLPKMTLDSLELKRPASGAPDSVEVVDIKINTLVK